MSRNNPLNVLRDWSFLEYAIIMGFLLSFLASLLSRLDFNLILEGRITGETKNTFFIVIIIIFFILTTYKSFIDRWKEEFELNPQKIESESIEKEELYQKLRNFEEKYVEKFEDKEPPLVFSYQNMWWSYFFRYLFLWLPFFFIWFVFLILAGILNKDRIDIIFPLIIAGIFILCTFEKDKILKKLDRYYIFKEKIGKWIFLSIIGITIIIPLLAYFWTTHPGSGFSYLFLIPYLLFIGAQILLGAIETFKNHKKKRKYPRVVYNIWKKSGLFENRRYDLVFEFIENNGILSIENRGFDEMTRELKEKIKKTNELLGIEEKIKESEMKECPECGHKNPRNLNYCTNCGKKLNSTICPNCNFENPEDAQYCGRCGVPLNSN